MLSSDDFAETFSFQGSASYQYTVNIVKCNNLRCVFRLYASTVKNAGSISFFFQNIKKFSTDNCVRF